MIPADRQREDQALDWVRRIEDPTFLDWEGHAAWLEADARNAAAFDTASLRIEDATRGLASARPMLSAAEPVNDNLQAPLPDAAPARRRWGVFGLAAAAVLVGVVTAPQLMQGRARPYLIQTAPGEQRSFALADGTRIALNGGSVVKLDRSDPRTASLENGQAFFSVVHDASHPFVVRSGDSLFQDVGTSFDMIRSGQQTEVAVREGAVMYDPQGAAVRLAGGQAITVGASGATVRRVASSDIGGWQQGRLSYQDVGLPEIAADLSRALGQTVAVDDGIKDRRFSGVIMIDSDRARMFRRMSDVMGIAIRPDGAGWRMALPSR